MKKLSDETSGIIIKENNWESLKEAFLGVRGLLVQLDEMLDDITEVVNFNSWPYVSQATAPTPEVDQAMIWKDSNATSGNPTHFLVYNDGGTIVTFASVETA